MAVFEDQVQLNCPPDRLFEFLSRPENLARISSPESGLSIVAAPDVLHLGARLEMKLQVMGQVQRVVHEVTHFNPPHGFTETQIDGPLSKWIHQHEIAGSEEGSLLIDRIDFAPPGGLLRFIATEDKILASLEDAFFHQRNQLKELLG